MIWTERFTRGIDGAAGQAFGFGKFAFTRKVAGEVEAQLAAKDAPVALPRD